MSFLNKIGLARLSDYNNLEYVYQLQNAYIHQLENQILDLEAELSESSDVDSLRDSLNRMSERYEELRSQGLNVA